MSPIKVSLIAALLCASPLMASAQQTMPQTDIRSDRAYCEQLFVIHERYLVPRGFYGQFRGDAGADLGIDLCRRQRTAEGISILERKLTTAGFRLPERG